MFYENIYARLYRLLSGMQIHLIKDTVLKVIDLFGVERCQFASNLPVENLWGWDAKRIFAGFLGIVENQFSMKISKNYLQIMPERFIELEVFGEL